MVHIVQKTTRSALTLDIRTHRYARNTKPSTVLLLLSSEEINISERLQGFWLFWSDLSVSPRLLAKAGRSSHPSEGTTGVGVIDTSDMHICTNSFRVGWARFSMREEAACAPPLAL